MLQTVFSAGINGVYGFIVTVECNCSNRLPKFDVVGLPDTAVKETRERIKAALENNCYEFPEGEITVNMAPADKKKQGSAFDLAIFIDLVGSCHLSDIGNTDDCCFIGELSLSGEVRPVNGVLCMCIVARDAGKKRIFVSVANAAEASVTDNVSVYGIRNVSELLDILSGRLEPKPCVFDMSIFERDRINSVADFSDAKGQAKAKRALEIAASRGHNVLLIGPPGTGKSMFAKRLPTILPPLNFSEAIETTKFHSISGLLPENVSLLTLRPFRSPHHTLSPVALAGGDSNPVPGEISLAHNGVLFLDELPEISKQATEVLRQPLEDRQVTITRATGHVTFPCSFMIVAAMNPCRCGYYGTGKCTCREKGIKNYLQKISGPMLDRIDIQVGVSSVSYDELSDSSRGESSAEIRERVIKARMMAIERFSNATITPAQIRKYCILDEKASKILRGTFDSMGLSARGHDRILHVARTIADLDGSENISAKHIAEAIQLRSLDRKYW